MVTEPPGQIEPPPVTENALGTLVTKAVTVAVHPREATAYEIVVDPTETLDTTPELLIVATVGVLLLHTPPEVASANVVLLPIHIDGIPVIGANAGTVSVTTELQPVGAVYDITGFPPDIAVTTPVEEPTVA